MNQTQIRNFAIIAHVDAGKSTLSDRLMELTGTVQSVGDQEQMLDSNPIERERGVTIKLAPVSMVYRLPSTDYRLNLIDTPGHMDFAYEVERSLAAGEGAILLMDGTRGIQAQTLSHARKATDLNLVLIPAINKIDLSSTDINRCLVQLNEVFHFPKEKVSLISAKTGQGISQLLQRIVSEIPPPKGAPSGQVPSGNLAGAPLRALIFNSIYDDHLGVIAFVRVVDGAVHSNEPLQTMRGEQKISPKEIGIFTPQRQPVESLTTGQVGYVATGLKDIRTIKVGDTITNHPSTSSSGSRGQSLITSHQLKPLPGYKEPKPLVFADIFPSEGTTYQQLIEAVEKLRLSDASLSTKPISSSVLGPGLHLGFLGLFHIEITKERLKREQQVKTSFTSPTVNYQVSQTNGAQLSVQNPNQLPDRSLIKEIKEPIVKINLVTPAEYLGPLMQLLEDHRASYLDTQYITKNQTVSSLTTAQLIYRLPLVELIGGLIDKIKSASQGYATLDYEPAGYQSVDAVKLTILVNHQPVETLTRLVVRDQASRVGREMAARLKELLPPQLFAFPIQAAVGGPSARFDRASARRAGGAGKIIARETKKAVRKDVTAKLYGGDQTRKDKLLKKQKKGKKRMAQHGKVRISEEVLTGMMNPQ